MRSFPLPFCYNFNTPGLKWIILLDLHQLTLFLAFLKKVP